MSAGAYAARFGAEDLHGGLDAASADPDTRSGHQRGEVLAAAKRTGPAAVLGPADEAGTPTLDWGDPFLEFLLDPGGVDVEVAQDTSCGAAGVGGQAEQQVLGAALGLSAPGGQPPGPGEGLVAFAVADKAAFLPAGAGDHGGFEQTGVGLADLLAGDAELVEDGGGAADVQKPEQQVLGAGHAVVGVRGGLGGLEAGRQARGHDQGVGGVSDDVADL